MTLRAARRDSIVDTLGIEQAYELVTGASTANAKRRGREVTVQCPDRAHEDAEASCDLDVEKNAWTCRACHAGGGMLDVAIAAGHARDSAEAATWFEERLGVTPPRSVPSALVVAAAERPQTFATIELLANHKCLDPGFLRKLGLADIGPERALELGVRIDGTGVLIPYPGFGGVRIRSRVRQFVETSHPSKWADDGASCGAYGSDRTITRARKRGSLTVVEGESDCWTLWSYGIPALGIPGASMTKYIEVGHIEDIPILYVVHEPGQGGTTFVEGVAKRLRELGWPGELRVVNLHAAHG